MTRKSNKKLFSLILSMMLIVAMAFNMTACGDSNNGKTNTEAQGQNAGTENDADVQDSNAGQTDDNVLGEGATVFTFVVVDKDGNETTFEIHTDKTTVGEALQEVELIAGEESEYGLYVKTVNGITADYNVDGTYWAFYINGEMAMTGVDSTNVEEGATYTFKVE